MHNLLREVVGKLWGVVVKVLKICGKHVFKFVFMNNLKKAGIVFTHFIQALSTNLINSYYEGLTLVRGYLCTVSTDTIVAINLNKLILEEVVS